MKKVSLYLFLLLLFFPIYADASHFRSAIITVRDAPSMGPFGVTFQIRYTARRSYHGNPNIGAIVTDDPVGFVFGDGSPSVELNIRVIAIDTVRDTMTGFLELPGTTTPGEVRHAYPSAGPWTAYVTDCCRVQSDPLNSGKSYQVETRFTLDNKNRCPVVNAPSNVDVPPNSTLLFVLPANDQDKDPLTYRFTTAAENAGLTQPPGMTINPGTGLVTWAVPANQPSGSYTASFAVSDGVCRMPVDMTFTVTTTTGPANQLPVFDSPPSPCGQTLTANVGQPLTFIIQASDPDTGNVVSLNNNGLPTGATFTTTPANPATATFSWTPSASQSGLNEIVVFTATDGQGSGIPCSVTINVGQGCVTPPTVSNLAPRMGTVAPASGRLTWSGSADSYNVFLGRGANGCNTQVGTTSQNSFPYNNLIPGTSYSYRIEAVRAGCTTATSSCVTFTAANPCPNAAATTLVSPAAGATGVASPVMFQWTAVPNATGYELFVADTLGQGYRSRGVTTATQLQAEVFSGPISWYVETQFADCPSVRSSLGGFTAGTAGTPPGGTPPGGTPPGGTPPGGTPPGGTPPGGQCPTSIAKTERIAAIALIRSKERYRVEWEPVPGADAYELDESTTPNFALTTMRLLSEAFVDLSQEVTTPTGYYYRVRARNIRCNLTSDNSDVVRTVVVPPDPPNLPEFTLATQFGNTAPISQNVLIVAGSGNLRFNATTDQPWLTVTPSSGVIPAGGVLLTVTADPSTLPIGASTGTLIVTTSLITLGVVQTTPVITVPISVSTTLPVAPVAKTAPTADSLIVPAVAHLDGFNSTWRSDVRIANTDVRAKRYRVQLMVNTGAEPIGRETVIEIGPGSTIALDDVVKNWFGFGPLGDGANAVLEIRPVDSAPPPQGVTRLTTVATSRNYNVTPAGTIGAFMRAIPYGEFIANASQRLVMVPVSQNALFRTNLGIVEAAGEPATVLARFFNAAGTELFSQTIQLKSGEQRQLLGLLSERNITATNGWFEVNRQSTTGSITSYASVIDAVTADSNVLIGTDPLRRTSNRYVVAGIGHLVTGRNNWSSDVTILNNSADPVTMTLAFSPLGTTEQVRRTVTIGGHESRTFTNIAQTLFERTNTFGGVTVETTAAAPLTVSGRTFDDRGAGGTLGQSVPAFTPADAIGIGERPLQILQVEESERYRSNLGVLEVTGNPVVVEITGLSGDGKSAPRVSIPLAGGQFIQISSLLKELGLGRTYNGRITVAVTSGTGRVAAYVSTIDNRTEDPTYVPAQ